MSVLADIVVQNGEWIRCVASELHVSKSKRFMVVTKKFKSIRMDEISYTVKAVDIATSAAEVVNHYWINNEGNFEWGLPGGDYSSFVDRIIGYKQDWNDYGWFPDLKRETTEQRARDLLLATYLFPFKTVAKHCDPVMTYGVLECLERMDAKVTLTGSDILADLILAVNDNDAVYEDIKELIEVNPAKAYDESVEFNAWMVYFGIATSTNPYDSMAGASNARKLDKESYEEGVKYTSIAGLANYCNACTKLFSRRGRLGKAYRTIADRAAAIETFEEWEKEIFFSKSYDDLMGGANRRSLAARSSKSEGVRVISGTGVHLIHIKRAKKFYIVTDEQLKACKFVSMTHALWKFHLSSLPLEYMSGYPVDPRNVGDHLVSAAIGQITRVFDQIEPLINMNVNSQGSQRVVSYKRSTELISRLWTFYMDLVRKSIAINRIDYTGRYLHELFEIYTATIAGHLAVEGLHVQKEEMVETYTPLGFNTAFDMDTIVEILIDLPMSCAQDFGRLAKIVAPYEVNPIYSYMHRVNAMQKPNPIGRAVFTDDYRFKVVKATVEEDIERKNKFLSASRVMIAMADLKTSAMQSLNADIIEKLGGSSAAWHDVMKEVRIAEISIACNFRYRPKTDLIVPKGEEQAARDQAKDMINKMRMPNNPYAGAYLDVDDIFSYVKRTDPDIAFLKPSSIPSGNLAVVFSNVSGAPRTGPTRDNSGNRTKNAGNMVTDYLLGILPNRIECLAFFATGVPVATTSDKIETSKYPLKTRIITGLCGEARRLMSEYEHNSGKALSKCPGFTVGADPADVKRSMYAAMRDDQLIGETTLYISLDLSSWSTGMHWDIQTWANTALKEAFDGGDDMFKYLEYCTKDSFMVRSEKNIRLFSRNSVGANYEGVDGKRNTFMHCVLWYIARCEAYSSGVQGTMRSLIFIDDGTAAIRVLKTDLHRVASILRRSLVSTYVKYGFKLSMLKSVVSETYAQFLNEIYMHGIHVGYGFRALCHTAAQTFASCLTVSEELSVITGGIRGAAVSGGNPMRLMVGMNFILNLYIKGVIGNKGKCLDIGQPFAKALAFSLPSIARGFGLPNYTQLFSNLAGFREIEKLNRVTQIIHAMTMQGIDEVVINSTRLYIKSHMSAVAEVSAKDKVTRIGISHPTSTMIGAHGRSELIARYALQMCKNDGASSLLKEFLNPSAKEGTFAQAFVEATSTYAGRLPVALVEKAIATDPDQAMSSLVEKIASSNLIEKIVPKHELVKLNRRYYSDGVELMRAIVDIF